MSTIRQASEKRWEDRMGRACKYFLPTSSCPLPRIKMSNVKMCGVGGFHTPCLFDSVQSWGSPPPSILWFLMPSSLQLLIVACTFPISLNLFLQSNYQPELYYYSNGKLIFEPVIKKKIVLTGVQTASLNPWWIGYLSHRYDHVILVSE